MKSARLLPLLLASLTALSPAVRAVEIEAPGELPSASPIPALPAPASQTALPVPLDASAPAATLSAVTGVEAAATAQAAGAPAQAQTARAEILKALAPENAGKISDAQAKELSGDLLEPAKRSGSILADSVVTGGPSLYSGPVFAQPAAARAFARQTEPAKPLVVRAAATLRDAVLDRAAYARLWVDHLHFYVVRNIVAKWGAYQRDRNEAIARGVVPSVTSPRAFFGHMRVMGQTGRYYPLGFTPRDNESVMKEARASFRRFFDAPGIGPREYAAFEDFMRRALSYNAEKRAKSNFVKRLRDKMLEASLLPADKIAGFFDARVKDDKYIKDFQNNGGADAVLGQFKNIALDLIAREPASADGKVLGILLIGSFANGGATPGSDFDVSVITANGSRARAKGFMDAFVARWGAERQKQNTVTFHEAPLRPSRWLVDKIHDCNYIIISPDNGLVEVLQRKPGEPPAFVTSKVLTPSGRVERLLQYAAVETTMLLTRPAPPKK